MLRVLRLKKGCMFRGSLRAAASARLDCYAMRGASLAAGREEEEVVSESRDRNLRMKEGRCWVKPTAAAA
jgi:hypothetical protein